MRNDIFTVSIEKHIGTISEAGSGWTKELNKVSWNGKPATMDIREWDPAHERMSKGVRLTDEEAKKLLEILQEYFQKG